MRRFAFIYSIVTGAAGFISMHGSTLQLARGSWELTISIRSGAAKRPGKPASNPSTLRRMRRTSHLSTMWSNLLRGYPLRRLVDRGSTKSGDQPVAVSVFL